MNITKCDKIVKLTRFDFLFFTSYFLLIFYRIIKSTTIGFDDNGLTYILVMLLFVGRIISLRLKVRTFLSMCFFCPIILLSFYYSWDPAVPVVALALIASKDIDFDAIVKVSFYTVFPIVMLIVVLASLGFLRDAVNYRVVDGVMTICHGAGFNHSSALPTYYCFLFLEYYYLRSKRSKEISLFNLILWLIGGLIIYHFCIVRLRFYLLIIALFFAFLAKYKAFFNVFEALKRVVVIIYPLFCVFINLLAFYYTPANSLFYRLNVLLSNRLYLGNYALKNFGISLFGQQVEMGLEAISVNGNYQYFYLDSGYIYIFVIYGLLLGMLILGLYSLGAYKSSKNNCDALIVWFVCMAIDPVVGNQMISIWTCPLLFFAFCNTNEAR